MNPVPEESTGRESLIRKLQERIGWYQANLAKLDRDRKKLRWLLLLLVATVPAGYFWGLAGVGVSLVIVVFVLGSAGYLVWGHKLEYQQKIAKLQSDLRKL